MSIIRYNHILSFPKVSIELVCSSLTFLGALYFTVVCQKYSSNKRNQNIALPDILHINKLDVSRFYKATDVMMNLYIFLLVFKFNNHLPKFLWMVSVLYIVRALSFSMTILPKCGKMPDKDNNRTSSKILLDYITLKDTHIGHNNDLLPSGHVSFSTLFLFYIGKYKYVSPRILRLMWCIHVINSFFIIISRCHYSIDVFYAYILTQTVYNSMKKFIFT